MIFFGIERFQIDSTEYKHLKEDVDIYRINGLPIYFVLNRPQKSNKMQLDKLFSRYPMVQAN